MNTPKIYADFQNLDDFNRLRLTCAGTLEDIVRQGLQLRDGLAVTLYMDDEDDQGRYDELLADGIVHFDEEQRLWVASIDWTAIRHASDDQRKSANGTPACPSATPKINLP